MSNLISAATTRNWAKLNTNSDGRLTGRANKRRSEKNIIPAEYLTHSENSVAIEHIVRYIRDNNLPTDKALYSVGIMLLQKAGIADCEHVRQTLNDYNIQPDETLLHQECPKNENDLLGYIYQCLMTEGHKNIIGSYYTPSEIVRDMTDGIDFKNGQTFLDPCCGSGAYLTALNCADPQRLFGIDRDRIAVMICRINLLLRYPNIAFIPNVECADFLRADNLFGEEVTFDYIMTNPPWGALSELSDKVLEIASNETFACFFVRAFQLLKCGGIVRFLFPNAVLNVKTHSELRRFMLNNGNLNEVTIYDRRFSGVTTECVGIELHNCAAKNEMTVRRDGETYQTDKRWIDRTHNCVLHLMNESEHSIIEKVFEQPYRTLENSLWALGIVTGDNRTKLHSENLPDDEPIYTGKEVAPYCLRQPKYYVSYNPQNFQQAAPLEMYRVPEKLVYKFISRRLVFAYDDSGSLCLNSANILIPKIDGMSVKTVCAFLNSDLFSFMYQKMFGEIKILQGNLCQLPFIRITPKTDQYIADMVDRIIAGEMHLNDELLNVIFECYGLNEQQREIIKINL